MILTQNGKKKGAQEWRNGNAFLSRFFPIPIFYRSLPGTSLITQFLWFYLAPMSIPGVAASVVECNWAVIKCKASQIELHNESRNEIRIVKLQKRMEVKWNYIEDEDSLRQTCIYLTNAKSQVLEYSTRARQIVVWL